MDSRELSLKHPAIGVIEGARPEDILGCSAVGKVQPKRTGIL
jgi:hypothetical protein